MGVAEDRFKWNNRYGERQDARQAPQPHPLVARFHKRIPVGRMLDAACGLGRGIASVGTRADVIYGVDISDVAISLAKKIWTGDPRMRWIVADVAAMEFPDSYFSAVCAFGYTNWSFLTSLQRIVAPGGMVFYEGFSPRQMTVNARLNEDWTCTVEALLHEFRDWDILACAESGEAPYRVHLAALHSSMTTETAQ